MKKTLQSYNSASNLGATSKNLLVPSLSQVILYFLLSALLLGLFNIGRIWDYLNQSLFGGFDSIINDPASGFHQAFDTLEHSIILQVIFWVFLGSFIYILIWFVRNLVINILNDVVADNYVHPASYSRFRYWESVIMRKIFFSVSLLVLLFYFFAGWRLASSLADLAHKLVSPLGMYRNILELAGVVLVTMALLHSLVLITQITVNSWRFIYRDL